MARRHHIPVWLLKQFRPVSPWALDTTTGEVRPLGFKKVGQVEDAWSQDIEDDIMSAHDHRAAEIFHDRVSGCHRVRLTQAERTEFAKWLCLFAYRVPDSYAFVERQWTEIKTDTAKLRDHFFSQKAQLIDDVRQDYPHLYREVIDAYGKEEGEQILFDDLVEIASERSDELLAPAENVWHHNIRNSSLERDAGYLSGYHWTWLNCRHGLVIGDNPLVRWSPKENRSYRHVNGAGIEVTFPLGTNLCLHIHRSHRHDNGQRQMASKAQCEEFNRRQRLACIRFVYAGSREVLLALARAWPPPRHRS